MDHTFPITYAHCTKATPGQPDTAPFTRYEFRTVSALMYRHHYNPLMELADDFSVEIDGQPMGAGDTKEDASDMARYRLMDASRTAAMKAALATLKNDQEAYQQLTNTASYANWQNNWKEVFAE